MRSFCDYASQPIGNLFHDYYHDDPGANLVLIEGSANWCYYCNEEAPTIEKIAVDNYDKGVRVVTVLAEGLTQGVPSTEEDIARWVKKHKFKQQSMAIDPELRLFQFADSSAFPLHIVLDTRTMQIEWLCVGGEGGCDTKGAIEVSRDNRRAGQPVVSIPLRKRTPCPSEKKACATALPWVRFPS